MLIVVDSREPVTTAWFRDLEHVRRALPCGDYSIVGGELLVGIERKAVPDLLACVGRERERFERMLSRWATSGVRWRWLVVEGSLDEIEIETMRAIHGRRVTVSHVVGSLRSWAMRFGIVPWLARSPVDAERFAWSVLGAVERRIRAAAATSSSATA